jgi:tRNA G18 (ribose-2'-O)-methylase SpoU
MLRTADGLGIDKVYLTGCSPYPKTAADKRLPHVIKRVEKQIEKTALGAQQTLNWAYSEDINPVIDKLRKEGFTVTALEQSPAAVSIQKFKPSVRQALVVGNEVSGLDAKTQSSCDGTVEIPMSGKKESFNVSIASAIAMYEIAKKHKML